MPPARRSETAGPESPVPTAPGWSAPKRGHVGARVASCERDCGDVLGNSCARRRALCHSLRDLTRRRALLFDGARNRDLTVVDLTRRGRERLDTRQRAGHGLVDLADLA